ncbi:hypothetical protein [Nocardioides sp. AN3]
MDVAALVISILALGAAIASAVYSRRQAGSAERTARVEEQRRRDERAPTFEATIEDVNGDGYFYRLRLVLTSNEELERVEVRLPRGCSFAFTEHVLGVKAPDVADSTTVSVLPRARDLAWRVQIVSEHHRGDEWLEVRAISSRDGQTWTVPVLVQPPYGPLNSVP